MNLCYLGLDIGKSTIHAALLIADRAPKRKVIDNNTAGYAELLEWLKHQGVEKVAVCLEATSTYGHAIARCLHHNGYSVSIANPKAVHAYAESRLTRTKNDHVDAVVIAHYCRDLKPSAWTPPPPDIEQLQAWERRLQALDQMIAQERNRLETATDEITSVIQSHLVFMQDQQSQIWKNIQDHLDHHPHLKQQQQLLDSIPGIGPETAARMIAELGTWQSFDSARQLAAYAGLTPMEHSSGTSVQGKPRLCKIGNPRLRKLLFFPAMALLRWNHNILLWRDALLARGKSKKQVVGAIMHKLIRWVFGVLHSAKPFDAAIAFPPTHA